MKSKICIVALAIACLAQAQENELKFGLKVFPTIGWSRVSPDSYSVSSTENYTFKSDGAKVGIGFGVFADYYLNQNVAFTFGLNYIFSSSTYLIKKSNVEEINRKFDTQILQIPLGIKLISNEVVDNLKLYVSPGLGINFLTAASVDGRPSFQKSVGQPVTRYNSELNLIDLSVMGSGGMEYELANEMKLVIGITYMHGLLNANRVSNDYIKNSDFTLKNNILCLDLGLKF